MGNEPMTKTATHVLLLLALSGCLQDMTIVKNVTPKANAGADQALPYDGQPVEVTLDGSGTDVDGTIQHFIWQSGNNPPDGGVPDGGMGPDDWDPEDIARPRITLDRGEYDFILWVVDDKRATSAPDRVTIAVGEPLVAAPPVVDAGSDDDAGN